MIMKSVETLVDERTIGSENFGANLDMKKNQNLHFPYLVMKKKNQNLYLPFFSRVNILSKLF